MKWLKWLSPAQRRALLPACAPVNRQRFTAFLWVVTTAVGLLMLGVPGGSLPAVLGAVAVLTVVLTQMGPRPNAKLEQVRTVLGRLRPAGGGGTA